MGRIKDIKNQWGVQGGPNPQRTDLWQVDMSEALLGLDQVAGLNASFDLDLPRYYVASLSLPEQKIQAEMVPRDSRRYHMPSWDDPLDAFKLTFIFDDGGTIARGASSIASSKVVKILTAWRQAVRAGRGSVGSEQSIALDANYRIDYRFPINVFFCRGYGKAATSAVERTGIVRVGPVRDGSQTVANTFDYTPTTVQAQQTTVLASSAQLFMQNMDSGLELSAAVRLENAWLAGFRVSELNYEAAKTLTIEATLYAENVYHLPEQ